MTVDGLWSGGAAQPADIALEDARGSLSYAQLQTGVEALAAWLTDQSVAVVGLLADNGRDWVLVDLACQAAGLVCLPLPAFFSNAQLMHCLQAVDLLITDKAGEQPFSGVSSFALPSETLVVPGTQFSARRLPVSAAGSSQREGATALPRNTGKITFTSGSTGSPKGVCLSSEHQRQVAASLAQVIDLRQPRHLCLLPLATLLENIAGVYAPLLCGGRVILPSAEARGLSGSSGLNLPKLLAAIESYQPHSVILLPQLLRALVAACQQGWQPPGSLVFMAVGGGKVAPELIVQARGLGLPVYEGYGLSECGSVVALNTLTADQPGCVGQCLPHCRVAVEDGEIVVKGASFLGYMGQPESWAPDAVRTGDLGSLRDQWLSIEGRQKNLLISSFGRNISPEWVESALFAQPLLTQCVVLGEARPYLVALLSAVEGATDAAIQAWIDSVNASLPDYANIRQWARLNNSDWQSCLTANGRPRRDLILQHYAELIQGLYEDKVALVERVI
ncbi:long-chain fatty acid--CoA ligase [Aestuariicella hydrocarbonica]|uniref:Long-chain fatty acid--CoA ligase n=1 Tax=Pseudomaricurvus hydrocarbonicus TaxID=1470433 RepID=A0A9E5MK71_9GAMM|nr:AMP-binding protein [Aestuariicella hydrocarbonica]NHO64987.1 long-chain fatty acid--CoA ligase [Aestuariicella hydrocarbonica]